MESRASSEGIITPDIVYNLLMSVEKYYRVYLEPVDHILESFGQNTVPYVDHHKEEYYYPDLIKYGVWVKQVTRSDYTSHVVVKKVKSDIPWDDDTVSEIIYNEKLTPYTTILVLRSCFEYENIQLTWDNVYFPEATTVDKQVYLTLQLTSQEYINEKSTKLPKIIEYISRFDKDRFDSLTKTWGESKRPSTDEILFEKRHPWLVSKLVHRSPYDSMTDEDLKIVYEHQFNGQLFKF